MCESNSYFESYLKKARRKHQRSTEGFMDFEKEYDRVNGEDLWQGVRMNDVGGKILNDIE